MLFREETLGVVNQVLHPSSSYEMTDCFCEPRSPHESLVAGARLAVVGLGLQSSFCYKLDGLDVVGLGMSTGSC